ncbi:MAG: hypothetical protein WCJ64_14180 [Rhodospirillaceae bacterium]
MSNALLWARNEANFTDSVADWSIATNMALPSLRDALVRAIGSGALTISTGNGVSRTFRSVAELQSALSTINALIAKSSRSGPRISTLRVSSSSGW